MNTLKVVRSISARQLYSALWCPYNRLSHQTFSVTPIGISTSELHKRRQSLALLLGRFVSQPKDQPSKHILIFPSAELQYMAHHVPYPFRQDSTFMYLTNFSEPNAVLAMSVFVEPSITNSEPVVTYSEHLFIEVRDSQSVLWNGPTLNTEQSVRLTGVQSVSCLSSFSNFIDSIRPATVLWYSPLVNGETESPAPNRFVLKKLLDFMQKTQKKHQIRSPSFLVDSLRYVKSPEEIRLLQLAANLTVTCLKRCMAVSYPGISESTLQGHMEMEARSHGSALSYPPVIAGGPRALIIHYLRNNQLIPDGELVLADVGCHYGGYTADISRAWPVNGRFNSFQLVLHDILEEVQHTCARFVTCEISLQDVHQFMLAELKRHLITERIIPTEDADKLVSQICPHSVGHYLGLDVHDTPTVSQSKRFEPGVVFPLEPGIYIRPELKKYGVLEDFVGYGLRLEDDFMISSSGTAVRLTDDLPTSARLIEALIGKPEIQKRPDSLPTHTVHDPFGLD